MLSLLQDGFTKWSDSRAFVSYVPCVLTCLKCLMTSIITLALMWLHFFACLTFAHFYVLNCLTCLYFLRAFRVCTFLSVSNFWRALSAFTHFMTCGTTQNQLQKVEISKSEYFVFQNLEIFDFELVLQKQPLWSFLKILIRIPWFKFSRNTFE